MGLTYAEVKRIVRGMGKTETSKRTSIILTPADRRNANVIISKGYVANIAAAIRYALAVVAKGER